MEKENQLLYQIICRKINSPLERPQYIKKLMKEIENAKFITVIRKNKCLPIVYDYIDEFDEEIKQKIREEYAVFKERTNIQKQAAIEIAKCAEKEEITIIEPKGIALAKVIYGKIEKREFGDIDLVVSIDELKRLGNMLVELGYFHRHDGSIRDICEVMEYEQGLVYEIKFFKFIDSEFKVKVELKKATDAIEYSSIKEFFLHKEPLYLDENTVYHTFEINYLFLHLCSNIYTDHYKYEGVFNNVGRLRDYVDLYFFYKNRNIIDSEIYILAKHFHLEQSVAFCKCMMKKLFEIDMLPGGSVVEEKYPETVQLINRTVKKYFWQKYIAEQKMLDSQYGTPTEEFKVWMQNIGINLKWEKGYAMNILLKFKSNELKVLENHRLYLCFIANAEKPVREEDIGLDTFYSNNQSVIIYMREGKIYYDIDKIPLFHVPNASVSNKRLKGRKAETQIIDGDMFVSITNIKIRDELWEQAVHFNAFLDIALLENYYQHSAYLYPLGTPFQKIW